MLGHSVRFSFVISYRVFHYTATCCQVCNTYFEYRFLLKNLKNSKLWPQSPGPGPGLQNISTPGPALAPALDVFWTLAPGPAPAPVKICHQVGS